MEIDSSSLATGLCEINWKSMVIGGMQLIIVLDRGSLAWVPSPISIMKPFNSYRINRAFAPSWHALLERSYNWAIVDIFTQASVL
jgi:hypothetical protein